MQAVTGMTQSGNKVLCDVAGINPIKIKKKHTEKTKDIIAVYEGV